MNSASAIVPLSLACGQFYGLRTATPDVVCLMGSFRTRPATVAGDMLLQQLVSASVSTGTRQRDQAAIEQLLDRRGAWFDILSDLDRVRFSVQACAGDLPVLIELLAECLREPRFDAERWATEQARLAAMQQQRLLYPAEQAEDMLSRLIYPAHHPRHQTPIDEQLSQIERLTIDDAKLFHQAQFGANDLQIVAVGDIDPMAVAHEIERRLGGWQPSSVWSEAGDSHDGSQPPLPVPGRVDAVIPGAEGFDVLMAQPLALAHDDPDFAAIRLANHILGGTSTARLGASLRDAQALTYAVRSSLAEPVGGGGHWQIAISLSPDRLAAGIDAVRAEVDAFLREGVSQQALAAQASAFTGRFQIQLATLSGLTETILAGAERHRNADYIYDFPEKVRRVTAAQLQHAIRRCLLADQWHIAVAGPSMDTCEHEPPAPVEGAYAGMV